MSDDPHRDGNREHPSAEGAALSARLRHLGEQLDRTAAKQSPGNGSATARGGDASGFARGFRLSSELVAGVLVGAGLGWLLDRTLGTSPWGMIVLLLLGFAAGVMNVMRAAGVAPKTDGGAASDRRE